MIITVASYKGGVGKTTTAVHLAAFLQGQAPTLLLDGDGTHNALNWARRRTDFPVRVAPAEHGAMLARQYSHVVIDTGQKPSEKDLESIAGGCDLLVIPAVPAWLDTDGLVQTIRALQALRASNYKVLLSKVGPDAAKAADELRALLAGIGAPVFVAEIPRLKVFEKASGEGEVVSAAVDPRTGARAWAAFEAAGREVLG